jgi:hypothetical protein
MKNIRASQLNKLIAEFGGEQVPIRDRTGISLAQLGQYLSGYRNMGEKTARKIERGCGKPHGWMDGESEKSLSKDKSARLTEDEWHLVRTYRKLSDEGKRLERMSISMFANLHPAKK